MLLSGNLQSPSGAQEATVRTSRSLYIKSLIFYIGVKWQYLTFKIEKCIDIEWNFQKSRSSYPAKPRSQSFAFLEHRVGTVIFLEHPCPKTTQACQCNGFYGRQIRAADHFSGRLRTLPFILRQSPWTDADLTFQLDFIMEDCLSIRLAIIYFAFMPSKNIISTGNPSSSVSSKKDRIDNMLKHPVVNPSHMFLLDRNEKK